MNTHANLQLAFDVGHSSLGWAVLENRIDQSPHLLGCGTVIFQADDCLASQRRAFRRQRRHIRSTRQRIARMKTLLAHLGVLTATELDAVSSSSPWLLAARVLANGDLLTWPQLWDVLRWVAHNRGYDGNKRWSKHDGLSEELDEKSLDEMLKDETLSEAQKDDAKKVKEAKKLLRNFGTHTMAETFCRVLEIDPKKNKTSSQHRFKGLNAAFPREIIEREVRTILGKHVGTLPKVDDALIRALMEDWRTIPCAALKLPLRYAGGLLFGQLVPRFENRIIATCPITFERVYQKLIGEGRDEETANHEAQKLAKVPDKKCPEFFRFRWAMQLANIVIVKSDGEKMKFIENKEWREALNKKMEERGHLTPGELTKTVRELTGTKQDNLQQMFTHPDAKEALLLDPVQQLISSDELAPIWELLPERLQKRLRGQWRRGKKIAVSEIREQLSTLENENANSEVVAEFDAEIQRQLDASNTRKKQKSQPLTRDAILAKSLTAKFQNGRAAYHREILRAAYDDVMQRGIHPKEEGGTLFRDEAIRNAQLQRKIDDQTNNHLVRHRLKILERLHGDIVKEFANGDLNRVERATIEVNRDLREMSGKTAKQVAQDLGQRLGNFKSVVKKLEVAFEGKNIPITAGLIRKARIAEDLGWHCPYTGKSYDAFDLLYRKVDKDHIVPRSLRPSDSLDSLVITFAEVNKMKSKRTAVQFVEQEQGKEVPGLPGVFIKTFASYLNDVKVLDEKHGHEDDKRRKKNRKRLLQIGDYVEKEFTPGDLTQTSQLVRLGAQTLEKAYKQRVGADGKSHPLTVISLPGSVTGTVRKSWNLLGCLSAANSQVLDENGSVKSKTEIRDITHLHHALDACVIALTSRFIPRDGGIWELLVKRRLNADEQQRLRQRLGNLVKFSQDGELRLVDLPDIYHEQIRSRLADRRVVQHIPKEMTGLSVEQNAWGVIAENEDGTVLVRQRVRQPDGSRKKKEVLEKKVKLLGLMPSNGIGKLVANKGVLVIPDNYGVAILDHAENKRDKFVIIPWHLVYKRIFKGIDNEKSLIERNSGKMPRILRNGQIIRVYAGTYKDKGAWKITSIKNQKSGIKINLAQPDTVNTEVEVFDEIKNKKVRKVRDDCKHEASLESIVSGGLEVLDLPLTGFRIQPIPR